MIKTDEKFDINYLDASSMCSFNRCPAKYLFSRLMGLQLPDTNTIAMDFGTDMHVALPMCYEEDEECAGKAAAAFYKCWSERGYGNDDKKRNPAKARSSLIEFHRLHKPSVCPYSFEPISDDVIAKTATIVSERELPFLVDIGGPLALAGRIDVVVRDNVTKDIWALDFKTASEISPRYFENFENSPAALSYTLALATILGSCSGLIIEAVRVSPVRVESVRHYIFISPYQLEVFVKFASDTAIDILTCNSERRWPQKVTGCAPYSMFGQPGRFCEFKDLCTVGKWQDMVSTYKQQEPYHPFKVEK